MQVERGGRGVGRRGERGGMLGIFSAKTTLGAAIANRFLSISHNQNQEHKISLELQHVRPLVVVVVTVVVVVVVATHVSDF